MSWKLRNQTELSSELISKYHLSKVVAKLFAQRGLTTDEQLAFWLHANENDLADPFLMTGMKSSVARINHAVDCGEKITVYGDYDADGITATSLLVETLRIMAADVHYYLPDRFKDGYGPNLACYQRIIADGTKLIITVDNAVTGVKEVELANQNGVDVIITDHHTLPDQLPNAFTILHAELPGQKYPFAAYAGCGIAYTLCRALLEDPASDLLDLSLIGTIGDMVSVTGENHVLLKRGLQVLNQTTRPGLRALIEKAGLKLGQVTSDDIGFAIAPRLNATGRLANANFAVDLLLTEDSEHADALAEKIEQLNDQRKLLTTQVYQEAMAQIRTYGWQNCQTLVLYRPNWHEGVLGLVANKVVEATQKPTIMLTQNDQGLIKGSGRSCRGFNIFDALHPVASQLLDKFGGHDFAVGLSMKPGQISALRHAFETSFQRPKLSEVIRDYDGELPLESLDETAFAQMSLVGPFGTDDPKPIFSLTSPKLTAFQKIGQQKNHVRFQVQQNKTKLPIVGFNKGYLNLELLPFIQQIFVSLSLNHWRGQTHLQGLLVDLQFGVPATTKSSDVFDMRGVSKILGFADRYLIFDAKNLPKAENQLGIPKQKLGLVATYEGHGEQITLLDAPRNQQQLNQGLLRSYQTLFLSFKLDQLPVETIPDKPLFGQTLKYVYAHPKLTIKDYRLVAPYLGMKVSSLYFILRVFLELNFVKMDNAWLVPNHHAHQHVLTDSNYFVATISQLNFITKLRTMPSQELLSYVNGLRK